MGGGISRQNTIRFNLSSGNDKCDDEDGGTDAQCAENACKSEKMLKKNRKDAFATASVSKRVSVKVIEKSEETKEFLYNAIKTHPLLQRFDDTHLVKFVDCMSKIELAEETVVLDHGVAYDKTATLFVIENGDFFESTDDDYSSIKELKKGDLFGFDFLIPHYSLESVRFTFSNNTKAIVWRLERGVVKAISREVEEARVEKIYGALKSCSTFDGLSEDEFRDLAIDFDGPFKTKPGCTLIRQGDDVIQPHLKRYGFFVITHGSVVVSRSANVAKQDYVTSVDVNSRKKSIEAIGLVKQTAEQVEPPVKKIVHAVEAFGERALLTKEQRSASVISLGCKDINENKVNKVLENLDPNYLLQEGLHDEINEKLFTDYTEYITLSKRAFKTKLGMLASMRKKTKDFYGVVILKSIPLIAKLEEYLQEEIMEEIHVRQYLDNSPIYEKNETPNTLFIVAKGTVKLMDGSSSQNKIIKAGEWFGGDDIEENERIETAITMGEVICYCLDKTETKRILEKSKLDVSLEDFNSSRDVKNRSIAREESKSSEIGDELQHAENLTCDEFQCPQDFKLGQGGFSVVFLAERKGVRDGKKFALKSMAKSLLTPTRFKILLNEKEALRINEPSPFICQSFGCFQTETSVHLILEYIPGCDLFSILTLFRYDMGKHLPERIIQFWICQVILALEHLHSAHIAYRDVKPENIMVSLENRHAKLVDFGFAKNLKETRKTWTLCGTPEYLSPEVILCAGHDINTDYWSLGVMIFQCFQEDLNTPFAGLTQIETFQNILDGNQVWEMDESVSADCQDVVNKLLEPIRSQRLNYEGLKHSNWLRDCKWKDIRAGKAGIPRNVHIPKIIKERLGKQQLARSSNSSEKIPFQKIVKALDVEAQKHTQHMFTTTNVEKVNFDEWVWEK